MVEMGSKKDQKKTKKTKRGKKVREEEDEKVHQPDCSLVCREDGRKMGFK